MAYLWLKTFHIVLITSWFAGLFYLPRIFVNLAMVPEGAANAAERDRLLLMANKLFRFMTPLGVLAVLLGLVLWLGLGIGNGQGWVHAKSLLVLGLIGFHISCRNRLEEFNRGEHRHSHVWYRWYNEIPVVLLVAIVILVVLKPF
ncbi:MAG: CopD family protein [Burkholderiales bacterium]|jgi:putative membrane protein|nr:CopD family protein [Betaproteobacteria bacterium]NBT84392.1 CopD family protein [Betaproteobacteria bacterium]